MADNENTTKVESANPEGTPEEESSEDLLSLESLDSILEKEDPEFAKSLSSIGPDDPSNPIAIEESDLEYRLEHEIKYWQRQEGWRQKLVKVLPFIPRVTYYARLQHMALRLTWRKSKEQTVHFLKNLGPSLKHWLSDQIGNFKTWLGELGTTFKGFSILQKLGVLVLVAATGVGGVVLYKIATNKLIPHKEELFLPTLEDWADKKEFFEADQVEPFYDSTRVSQNIFSTSKIFANIRRSSQSGSNPMAALEFFVEGTDADVVVEIKDREPEVKDLFLRVVEDMNYDQLSSVEGKQMLCERLRKEINKILTKGKVRRIFYKTAVIKP
ncbi:flagellar basal body-associated FliL family protein [Bdellovibrio sp. SKB1291214]|uniref:flagellar basal body-associated FliL family protein n=1 Tax=Bdellovibrio sp. SKB1291214 TaxID=1732569 RepID=UPI000B51B2ED|nr:flagellar basal body-associated FliL family protein [Bdellovibrio sp. SKB1291214]UYL09004.1 flagellar basal body-associated FliL family protein [Bdellovibrio sp. SKB1291214]